MTRPWTQCHLVAVVAVSNATVVLVLDDSARIALPAIEVAKAHPRVGDSVSYLRSEDYSNVLAVSIGECLVWPSEGNGKSNEAN